MKILVLVPFTDNQKKLIESAAHGADFTYCTGGRPEKHDVADADVIIGNIQLDLLPFAKSLKWLQLNSAGANQYCADGLLMPDVKLTNAAGAYGQSVSEKMLAYTMAMFKRLYQYHSNQTAHVWRDEGKVFSPEGAQILILGTGDLGTCYARKMKALGSYVTGVRRNSTGCPEGFDEVTTIDMLDEYLPKADLTAITLPATKETAGLFDEIRLRKMKKGSYLINVGRGNIVDAGELEKVMRDGYLSGAALDVTEPEPLPDDHPLWDTPGVWITPHVAGQYHLDATLENIAGICAENLKRFLDKEELTHLVDRQMEY